jgi:WD40 repeat protein/cytochrome c-type biogenesis protein CcmH/NrfG
MKNIKNSQTSRHFISKQIAKIIFVNLLPIFMFGFAANAQFVDTTRWNPASVMTHDEWATQIVSTPTGKEFISAGVDGHVVTRESATGKIVRDIIMPASVLTLSLSADGKTVAAGDVKGMVSLIETESGNIKTSFAVDKQIVNASAWSDDGKFLAAGGNEGIVKIWSATEQKIAAEINPAHGNIVSLAFANSQLIIGMINFKERQGTIEVWDWQNKKLIREFKEATPAVRGLSVSADKKFLAAADFEPTSHLSILPSEGTSFEITLRLLADSDEATLVAIWDLTTGKRVALIDAETGARSIAFSPDGKMLACAGINGVMIFDATISPSIQIGRIDSLTNIDAVAFSPDSKQLFISREREPFAKSGEGGLANLFDPFFTNMAMVVREGSQPSFTINTKVKATNSITGGSNIEIWQLSRQTAPKDVKTFEAVRAHFDKKTDEARKILQQVIKDFPTYGEAQRLNAVLFETADMQKVQSLLEASVKADPNCVSCWRSLGDVQHKNKLELEATKSYERALQLKPEYGLVAEHLADVSVRLANNYISAGNDEKNLLNAEKALDRALELRPANNHFYSNLSTVYYFEGDFDGSINLLLIAQKLNPDDARVYYNLGHSYRQKGDKQKAIEAYRRYVQMGEAGEEPRVEKAKNYIKQLSGN